MSTARPPEGARTAVRKHGGLLRKPRLPALLLGLAAVLPAQAQFALAVTPPRFELRTSPGETVRETVEFSHTDPRPGTYAVRTADWTLKPDGSVEFSDALAPGSCRPWVAIERREVSIGPGRPYRFRFEVTPPAGERPAECRFALMIEGKDASTASGLPLAIAGRIAVIVYVAVGDIEPVIEWVGSGIKEFDGHSLPALRIRNRGNAHGRLGGFLSGTDASGTRLEFQPEASAILPGETRELALVAGKPGDPDADVRVRFPVSISGKVAWGRAGSTVIDQRFSR